MTDGPWTRYQSREQQRSAAGPQLPGEVAAIGQGLTFGLLDEGAAGMRAGVNSAANIVGLGDGRPFGEVYNEGLLSQRFELEDARERNPVGTTIAEVGGAVIPAIATLGASLPGQAAMTVPRLAATGAAGGALAGFGYGEGGAENRLNDAAIGGGIGAALGPVVGMVPRVAGGVGRAVRERMGINPQRSAAERVARGLDADGMPLDDVTREMRRRAPDGRGETLMDVAGPRATVTGLGEGVAQQPGPGSRAMAEAFDQRNASQSQRIMADFENVFGRQMPMTDTVERLSQQRATAAQPLYQRAYAAGDIDNETINEILLNPELVGIHTQARRLARLQRAPSPRILREDGEAVALDSLPTVQYLDYFKQSLDDAISSAQRNGRNQEARALIGLRSDLLAELDEAVPDYAAARAAWAGPSAMIDAAAEGQRVFRASPAQIRETLSGMNESERNSYVIGMMDAVQDRMASMRDTANVAGRLWGSERDRERLRAVIDAVATDSAEATDMFNRLNDALSRENTMGRVGNAVVSGSQTARRQAAREMIRPAGMGMISDAATGMFPFGTIAGGAAAGAGSAGRAMGRRGQELIQNELAGLLMETNPDVLAQALQRGQRMAPAMWRQAYGVGAPAGLLATDTADQWGLLAP